MVLLTTFVPKNDSKGKVEQACLQVMSPSYVLVACQLNSFMSKHYFNQLHEKLNDSKQTSTSLKGFKTELPTNMHCAKTRIKEYLEEK